VIDYQGILERLTSGEVEFILIGGFAAVIHGSARLTLDVDVVYRRSPDNLRKLVAALAPIKPYLRGAPPGLPFQWDLRTLQRGLNFTLVTDLGAIDVLGEVAGGGTYEALLPDTEEVSVGAITFRVVSLRRLIALKRAAGRRKDLEGIAELEVIDEEGSTPPEC
jgi:predicted nucleotidyltransferase